ncbi:MAG: exodeoxyribonuclease VII small subunit [Nitrospinaceae bacterium]|jgi:exodeoxyribonuclease VII small subunit|nr:exodeoxyribonuclease VII small subunit [Nitrospinaceae bacterium]|tara:strand:+ start:341 stop:532 length:192 start_codon:yes stop_codon:yes gene_type:complete
MGTFKLEKAMQDLEKIVVELEKGEPDINRSLEIYEAGIKLSKLCSGKLREAEERVAKLTSDHL